MATFGKFIFVILAFGLVAWVGVIVTAQQSDQEVERFDHENKRLGEVVQSVRARQDEIIACLERNATLWKAGRREEATRKKCE